MKWVKNLIEKHEKRTAEQEVRQVASIVAKKRADVLKDLAEYDRGKKEYSVS